ncbi:MAG TPA: hypothetical protein VK009_19585 [Chloroflexota bacterium]|nr:hypothetical protein [Chloroflexota bacterium]
MSDLKEYVLELYLSNGARLQTRFRQTMEANQRPSTRFYLGYSSDAATTQDLPWITVGDIAYMPDEVVAVKIVDADQATAELPSHLRAV